MLRVRLSLTVSQDLTGTSNPQSPHASWRHSLVDTATPPGKTMMIPLWKLYEHIIRKNKSMCSQMDKTLVAKKKQARLPTEEGHSILSSLGEQEHQCSLSGATAPSANLRPGRWAEQWCATSLCKRILDVLVLKSSGGLLCYVVVARAQHHQHVEDVTSLPTLLEQACVWWHLWGLSTQSPKSMDTNSSIDLFTCPGLLFKFCSTLLLKQFQR